MSAVSATSSSTSASTNSASSSSSTTAKNTLSYDDFLTLLLAQMKYQDPTQPMDTSQMVTQMAQINMVSQQTETNSKLASMLTTNALTQAELAVGGAVKSSDGSASGTVQSVTVDSSGNATATLTNGDTITYSNGAVVQ